MSEDEKNRLIGSLLYARARAEDTLAGIDYILDQLGHPVTAREPNRVRPKYVMAEKV